MEFASERSGDGDSGLKEEKISENSVCDDDGSHKHEIVVEESPMANAEMSIVEAEPSASPSMKEDLEVDDQLEIAKTQMGEVREENQRLKMSLNKIMNEYRTLEMQFQDIVKQDQTKKNAGDDDKHQEIITLEESDLVSLSLGRVPSNIPRNHEKIAKVSKPFKDHEEFNDEELTLGLDCKVETSKSGSTTEAALPNPSPVNSCEVPKEEEAGETPPPTNKAPLKTMRDLEEEVPQQTHAKKARVCVRARCDTPTMNDGCQWRKYGQKISKGNPCPRAYYRCTVAPSCPVRKQVQRCVEDMSILITTYEGTHNHTLPHSATAMASTTSAAASMLLSGSSTSHHSGSNNLHGLNFYLSSDGSKSKQQLHHLSNPSHHHDHPTITLDLTSNPNSSSSSSSPFVRFNNQLRYPSSTSLSFNSSESNAMSWTNNGFLNYNTQPYNNNNNNNNRNNILSSVNFGRQTVENIYQSYMQKNNSIIPPQPETVSAATKAITAHPNFQSALAAALTSFIGSSSHGNLGQKMTWAELFPASSSTATLPSTSKANIASAASNFFNKTPSSLPFSTSKSASASPGDSNGNSD